MRLKKAVEKGQEQLGGKAYARVIIILACVLALDSADKGAIGAMARELQDYFNIGKTDIGLILAVSSAVTAIGAIPFGWLVDRTTRTRVLAIAILLWGVAMAVSASATSYIYLLITRLALGAVTAAATPVVASLVGDFFPPRERGRVYGWILSGELIGAGFGFLVIGELSVISWRVGLLGMTVPALILAWFVYRLPEPARGGKGRLEPGEERVEKASEGRSQASEEGSSGGSSSQIAHEKVKEKGVKPREKLVLDEDPQEKSLWWAILYVLRIPSNLVLIIASALGYYLFAGVRTFGVEYMETHFKLSHSGAIWTLAFLGAGSIIGVLVGGRLGDWLLVRGHIRGRVIVATVAYFLTGAFFLPGVLVSSVYLAGAPFFLAAASLGCVNPPLDAARLDIMHPHLWGRAEAVRMTFRLIAEAIAPLLFGFVAQHIFGGGHTGLQDTFLVMLIPLFVSGLVASISLRTYPRDVATAEAYVRKTIKKDNR